MELWEGSSPAAALGVALAVGTTGSEEPPLRIGLEMGASWDVLEAELSR